MGVSSTSNFVVKVGNGNAVTSQGICKGVSVEFPEMGVVQDFYLFPLEGSEVVLGLVWLDTLGNVIANFRESRLITHGDKGWVVLKGDLELCYGGLALRSAVRALQEGKIAFMIQLWPLVPSEESVCSLPGPIAQVLDENSAVF